MKPGILQKPMTRITDLHNAPCPVCQTDTLHLGPKCTACGDDLPAAHVPPPDRYRYPEPAKPSTAAGWRHYFGEPE